MHRRAAAMQAALNWTIILLIDQGHFLRPSSIVCIFASQYYVTQMKQKEYVPRNIQSKPAVFHENLLDLFLCAKIDDVLY